MTTHTTPDFDRFREIAGRGNVVPIYREILVDRETPVSAFMKFGGGTHSFLLESMEGGEKWGRYSMIGSEPSAIFTLRNGVATMSDPDGTVRETRDDGPPLGLLQDMIDRDRPVEVPGLPRLSGGAIGYVGYDMVRHLEKLPEKPSAESDPPMAGFIFFDSLLIFDNLRHTVKVVANARVRGDLKAAYQEAVDRIDALITRLRTADTAAPVAAGTGGEPVFESNMGREKYLRGVEVIREYIRAGDVFQTVLAHQLETETACRPFDAYRALRVTNPSPYMFYLNFGQFQIAGSSPEVLVRSEHGSAVVRPIAGTRRRGRSEDEDRALEEELLHDEKERSEHVMLVDLGRNDLGRVSLFGTVQLDESMKIERYSHVMHIVSNVRGTLAPEARNIDVLSACFPAGTVSGAPKVRAMEIIDELEPTRRGIYAGAVGYLDYHGNMDMCIAIRTIMFMNGRARIGVGAGIVADSMPEREWDETMEKSRAMTEAVRMAERGLDLDV